MIMTYNSSILISLSFILLNLLKLLNGSFVHIERIPNKTIEDGIEHAIRLKKNENFIFYFNLPTKNAPLFLTITPCGSTVHWGLYSPHSYVSHPANVHPNSAHFNNLLHVRIPPLVEVTTEYKEEYTLLAGQSDEKRMRYFNQQIDADYVMLNLTSSDDTTVRIFMTTIQSTFEKQYPPLPNNSELQHDIYNDHDHFLLYNIKFKWDIPLSIQHLNNLKHFQNRYKYCILLTKTPAYSLCPGKSIINELEHCVDQTTDEIIIKKLKSKGDLYATLFVYDTGNKGISALRPIQIKLPIDPIDEEINSRKKMIKQEDEKTVVQLYDGVVDEWIFPPIKGDIRNYDFIVPKKSKTVNVQVVVRACAGNIEIRIDKNGKRIKLYTHVSSSTRRFAIMANGGDIIKIQIVNHRNREAGFDIWASIHPELNPFPQLPDDMNLHAQSSKCNSAELQFYRVLDDRVAYCLYIEKSPFNKFISKRHINVTEQCWPSNHNGELITCFEDKTTDPEKAKDLIHMTVPGLQHDTIYRLMLTVVSLGKPYPRELKYKTQTVHTSKC